MPNKPPLDRLRQHTQAKRTTKRTTSQPPSLSEPADGKTTDGAVDYPKGYFGPKHGLTPAQAWTAQQLLNRANRRRPLPWAGRPVALRLTDGRHHFGGQERPGGEQCLWPQPAWASRGAGHGPLGGAPSPSDCALGEPGRRGEAPGEESAAGRRTARGRGRTAPTGRWCGCQSPDQADQRVLAGVAGVSPWDVF
jgi:hypothetical protein